jgi:hypothetical protein
MSGGGTQTTTEQSQTSYPKWTQEAQQNTDRDYVEFMVEMFEVDLAAAFANLMANAAFETPRTTH